MRPCLLVLLFSLLLTGPAHADRFEIATADTLVSRAIARVMEEAYQRLGIETAINYRPAARSFREVNSGKFDAELVRTTGLEIEFPNVVRVMEPVFTMGISAVVRSDSGIRIKSWEDLAGLRVGYPRGYRILDIRTQDMQAARLKDSETVFKMVMGRRIEVGLLMSSNANALVKDFSGASVLQPPIETIPLFHYVHIKHRRMIPALEKILIEMNDSGRSNELLSGKK